MNDSDNTIELDALRRRVAELETLETQYRQKEEALRQSAELHQEVQLLQSMTQAIAEAQDFHTALKVVLQQVCQAKEWDFGEAWIPHAGGTVLESSPVWCSRANNLEDFRKTSQTIIFKPGDGLPGRVWLSRQSEWIEDITLEGEKDFPRARLARQIGLKAACGIPIIANDQVLAILVFFMFNPHPEDRRQVEIVSAVAAQLSSLIQRKRVEAQMRKLSRVIEQTADQVIITDKDGLIEYVNPAFEELTGYTRAEAIGQTPRILKSGGHKPEYYQTFWDTILSGRVLRSVVINKKKNGELFYEEKTITPLKDGEGSITHFVSTGKDITKAKQLEEQLAAIYQLGQDLALLRDEATIAQRVLETATNVLRFEIACWGLVNQADSELEYRYRLVNGAVQAISHRLPLMTGREPEDIGAAVVRTGQLLNVPDVTSELYCAPLPEDWSSCSALCVPMKVGERVIGILNTESAEPNHFTAGDERLLQTLANQSAVALENARLHAETQRWANELSVLNRAGRVMASSLDMNTVLAQTLAEIKEVLHAEGASILRYTPGSDELVFVAAVGPNTQKILGTTVPIAASVAGRSLLEEQPILVEDTQQDFRFYNQIDVQTGMTTHSLLAVPLIFRENVIGVIEVMNKGQGVFNLHDLEILEAMTNSAAIAIKNAQLYETEREQYRRLQQSQTQLIQVEKLAAIGRLVGSIAHEVNNPVQAIQNCLTLSKEELAEQQRLDKVNFYIDIAKTELDRIANIIRRMRDFYHPARPGPAGYAPESDTIEQFYQLAPEELQVIEVHDILESVLQLANKQLQHSLVRVKNFWAENLPAIEGSSDHLKQVFLNLVLNAIDAMSPTGGVLTIRTRVDKVESPDGKPYPVVRLEFSDTGPGISPENQSRLFEPLFTTKAHGSGFGLFTSHKIIEAHCGQISVASQVGQGTTFTILLSVTHNPTYDPQN